MADHPDAELTEAEVQNLRRLVGIMVPASTFDNMPCADDPAIFDDIVRSLGRDQVAVQRTLADLNEMTGGSFGRLDDAAAEAAAMTLLSRKGPEVEALGRSVLQCYYRDDRVFLALGREPRAPFPKGHSLEQGDFTSLDAVRSRPRMWRDLDGTGTGAA